MALNERQEQSRIGMIVQYRAFAQNVEEIARSLGESPLIGVGWDERTVLGAGQDLKHKGVKVLVARGPWVNKLREFTDLPVFDYNPDAVDLLRVLTKARDMADTVGLSNVYGYEEDWEVFERALGIRILVSAGLVDPKSETMPRLEELAGLGARVFVGGELTLRCAESLGMPALYLESGPQSIRGALLEARELLRGVSKENERTQVLQTVLDNMEDGVVAFTAEGKVIAGNRTAADLTGLREIRPGMSLRDLPAPWRTASSLMEGTEAPPRILPVREKKVLFRSLPIRTNGVVTNGIVFSQEIHKVQKTEAYIRKNLYDRGFVARHTFDDMVAESPEMLSVIQLARQYSKKNGAILIFGETGAGKDLLAQSIHNASDRAKNPFVAVNCAALPETLLESELFGYEEGAFTGARKGGKPGLFEIAHGGTVFLDEISSMSPAVQARLLRVLEEHSVVRLGGDTVVPLNIRLISACNQDLPRKIAERQFREDLFFRVAVLLIEIPPLRERPSDIEPSLRRFLGLKPADPLPFSEEVMRQLKARAWPGNLRQLANFSERLLALQEICSGPDEAAQNAMETMSVVEKVADAGRHAVSSGELVVSPGRLNDMMASLLTQIVSKRGGSLASIASGLGISKSGLWKMLRRYDVRIPSGGHR